MPLEKIVAVKKATPLEELLRRHATASQVKFYLESRGDSFEFYKELHLRYQQNLQFILKAIPHTMRQQVIDKEHLATFQFSDKDLVVVIGDDGLLVNVAKYVGEQPILAMNADRQNFDGVLASGLPVQFPKLLEQTLEGKVHYEKLTMAEAKMEDGQALYALNDFFIGRKTHVSARYVLEYKGKKERQSSSGIIVATGTGSTGWLSSVANQARALTSGELSMGEIPFARSANYLKFVVREPFKSKITSAELVSGDIFSHAQLKIISNMPEDGVIFSDGIEHDYIEFTAGKTITIKPAERKITLIRPAH